VIVYPTLCSVGAFARSSAALPIVATRIGRRRHLRQVRAVVAVPG
jgi:hypothetical protein